MCASGARVTFYNLPVCPTCLPYCLPDCLPAGLTACLTACLPTCLLACLPACLPARLPARTLPPQAWPHQMRVLAKSCPHISHTRTQQAVHAQHSFYGRSWYDVVSIRSNDGAPWFAELRLLFHATLRHKTNSSQKLESFALVQWYADAPTTPSDVLSKSGCKRLMWAAQAGAHSPGWFQVGLADRCATPAHAGCVHTYLPQPLLLVDVHPDSHTTSGMELCRNAFTERTPMHCIAGSHFSFPACAPRSSN